MSGGPAVALQNPNESGPFLNGLQLARRCWVEQIKPFVVREFPALDGRCAVTILRGSQAFAADDEHSRDHGWGAGFDLILPDVDFSRDGVTLKSRIAGHVRENWIGFQLPEGARNWHSCRRRNFIDADVAVRGISETLESEVGVRQPPEDLNVWLRLPWNGLYYLRHGTVIDDPLGEWTRHKKAFETCPEPVRAHMVAKTLQEFWHYGSYNYLCRIVDRNDCITSSIALAHFAEAAMQLWCVLNRDYSPYWKWLHHEFLKQPSHELLEAPLVRMMSSVETGVQKEAVVDINRVICKRLVAENFMKDGDEKQGLNTVVDRINKSLEGVFKD
jgi:hypothetical protein